MLLGVTAWRPYSNLENKLLAVVLSRQGIENRRELLGVELDIHYRAYYLVDLAIPCRIRRGEPGGECRGERGPYGLESAAKRGRAERPLEAAVIIELAPAASPIGFVQGRAYLLSIV
jgi:hypothetical protein